MSGHFPIIVSILAVAATSALAKPPQPLPGAHAHNDYQHARPLLDALDLGFTSIEADVWLVDGELLVGHSRNELRDDRTLESLYLEPLARLVKERAGKVFADGPTLRLLVDFKTDFASTWPALKARLAAYPQLFDPPTAAASQSAGSEGQSRARRQRSAVEVVVTGNRPPLKEFVKEHERPAAYDGRLSDLGSDVAPSVMPIISDNWALYFRWRGRGAMPPEERQKLDRLVRQVHEEGRKLRFWATPDDESTWRELQAAGVDIIAADDLVKLGRFMKGQSEPSRAAERHAQ